MGIIFIMELYNIATPSFTGIEMAATNDWYKELKDAKGQMTCKSVAGGLKAWKAKVKASRQWKSASKAKRAAYAKKVWQRLMEFDAAKKCGWVAKAAQYCNEKRYKFDSYIRKMKANKSMTAAQKQKHLMTKVIPKVIKFLKKTKCHKHNVEWHKTATFIKASLAKMKAQRKQEMEEGAELSWFSEAARKAKLAFWKRKAEHHAYWLKKVSAVPGKEARRDHHAGLLKKAQAKVAKYSVVPPKK